jgi:hypothetical protein
VSIYFVPYKIVGTQGNEGNKVTPADSDSEALCLVALVRRPAFLRVVDDRVSAFA